MGGKRNDNHPFRENPKRGKGEVFTHGRSGGGENAASISSRKKRRRHLFQVLRIVLLGGKEGGPEAKWAIPSKKGD